MDDLPSAWPGGQADHRRGAGPGRPCRSSTAACRPASARTPSRPWRRPRRSACARPGPARAPAKRRSRRSSLKLPANRPGVRIKRIQLAVKAADVHGAVGADRGRGDHVAGHERAPLLLTSRTKAVHVEIERAPEAGAVGLERRRRPQRVTRREAPSDPALRAVRVSGPARVARVERAVRADHDVALPPIDLLAGDRRHRRAERPQDPRTRGPAS